MDGRTLRRWKSVSSSRERGIAISLGIVAAAVLAVTGVLLHAYLRNPTVDQLRRELEDLAPPNTWREVSRIERGRSLTCGFEFECPQVSVRYEADEAPSVADLVNLVTKAGWELAEAPGTCELRPNASRTTCVVKATRGRYELYIASTVSKSESGTQLTVVVEPG
jgi:hypothetical protein